LIKFSKDMQVPYDIQALKKPVSTEDKTPPL